MEVMDLHTHPINVDGGRVDSPADEIPEPLACSVNMDRGVLDSVNNDYSYPLAAGNGSGVERRDTQRYTS